MNDLVRATTKCCVLPQAKRDKTPLVPNHIEPHYLKIKWDQSREVGLWEVISALGIDPGRITAHAEITG